MTFTCPSGHGQMQPRPVHFQTQEQRFCGAWFDCARCATSILVQSPELDALHAEQRTAIARRAAKENPEVREAFRAWVSNACSWDGRNFRIVIGGRRVIAPWSRAVKKLYPTCDELHNAAHAAGVV